MSADIENLYLIVPFQEKLLMWAGPEFLLDQVSVIIISKALYGIKLSGAVFMEFLEEWLYEIGFKYLMAGPYLWLPAATKPDR